MKLYHGHRVSGDFMNSKLEVGPNRSREKIKEKYYQSIRISFFIQSVSKRVSYYAMPLTPSKIFSGNIPAGISETLNLEENHSPCPGRRPWSGVRHVHV